ncbi:MAG: hypothetical protein ACRD0Z_09765 [Acidimicrobiales bacterium]
MLGHEQLVERLCSNCGTAWLLTHEQAKLSTEKPHLRVRGLGLGPAMAPDQFGMGLDVTAEKDALLEQRDLLRSCPKCQLQNFTDHKVTKAHPASPDAIRSSLA